MYRLRRSNRLAHSITYVSRSIRSLIGIPPVVPSMYPLLESLFIKNPNLENNPLHVRRLRI